MSTIDLTINQESIIRYIYTFKTRLPSPPEPPLKNPVGSRARACLQQAIISIMSTPKMQRLNRSLPHGKSSSLYETTRRDAAEGSTRAGQLSGLCSTSSGSVVIWLSLFFYIGGGVMVIVKFSADVCSSFISLAECD